MNRYSDFGNGPTCISCLNSGMSQQKVLELQLVSFKESAMLLDAFLVSVSEVGESVVVLSRWSPAEKGLHCVLEFIQVSKAESASSKLGIPKRYMEPDPDCMVGVARDAPQPCQW